MSNAFVRHPIGFRTQWGRYERGAHGDPLLARSSVLFVGGCWHPCSPAWP